MTTQELETSLQEEHGPEGRGNYWCRVDPATCTNPGPFDSSKKRGSHEYQHRKKLEQGQLSKTTSDEQPADRQPAYSQREISRMSGGMSWDVLSERTKAFAVALDAAVDTDFRPQRRRQVLEAFEDDSDTLSTDGHELENFLGDYGLTRAQQRQIVRRVIGRPKATSSSYGDGASQIQALDPRTGQTVPLVVINPGNNQPAYRDSSPFIIMPQSSDQSLTRHDVADMIDERFDRLEERLRPPDPAPSSKPQIRRYQEVVTDPEGNWIIDNDGHPVMRWVEEPADAPRDPFAEAFQRVQQMRRMTEEPKGPTLEDMRALLREERERGAALSLDGYQSRSEAELERRLAVMETKEEMARTTREEVRAEIDGLMSKHERELREYRDQFSGGGDETDFRAQLRHERGMLNDFKGGLHEIVDSFRDDLKPFAKMIATQNLRSMGMSEQGIVDLLKTEQQSFNSTAEARRARQVEERWSA